MLRQVLCTEKTVVAQAVTTIWTAGFLPASQLEFMVLYSHFHVKK